MHIDTAALRAQGIHIVHAGQQPPNAWDASVFLAGSTPRQSYVLSWRPEFVAELAAQWDGRGKLAVFVPEPAPGASWPDYPDQRRDELFWGDRVDVVAFWMPFGPAMKGLTTRDEWGRWKDSLRVVAGAPPEAENVRYQRDYALDHGIPFSDSISDTVSSIITMIGSPARRAGAERHVPLHIWRTPTFQNWRNALREAGNELRSARQAWVLPVGGEVFFWTLHVAVYVTAEDRIKDNEVVFGRPDISTVVAYRRGRTPAETEILTVREFRPACLSSTGRVHEIPGGSKLGGMIDPRAVAASEISEETGLVIAPERLVEHLTRQIASAMSVHRAHVFSVEITEDEYLAVVGGDTVHGVAADTELTYAGSTRLANIFRDPDIDYSYLGMISQVLVSDLLIA